MKHPAKHNKKQQQKTKSEQQKTTTQHHTTTTIVKHLYLLIMLMDWVGIFFRVGVHNVLMDVYNLRRVFMWAHVHH
jgi:hypothetical protein